MTASAETPTVAIAILRTLSDLGVTKVFGLPGVHNLAFWQGDGWDVPQIIGTRHEQTTVYAADSLARATGKLGVALTTTGPGVANAAGAFGEAAACGSPVLLISSEVSTKTARPGVMRGGLHESRDQAAIFEPLAKAVFRPRTAEGAVRAVATAIEVALQWPQGPVYVDIPMDILEAPGEVVAVRPAERPIPAKAEIDAAIELITSSEKVVVWAGGGVVQSEAEAELIALAELLQAPIVTTWAGRGVVPSGHPLNVDLPPHEPEVAALIASAELLIAVGSELDGPNTKGWTMKMPTALLAINADATSAAKNYPTDAVVIGDAKLALQQLAARLERRPARDVALAPLRERVTARDAADPRTASAVSYLAAIDAVVDRNDVTVVNDMAVGGYWLGGYGRFRASRRMQYPIGWGTLGYALPASVGPGSLKDRPVLAICGDGGIMFGLGELAVLVENDLPVTVLLIDDGGYGMLRFDQIVNGHAENGVDLVRPDFAMLSESFGIPCITTTMDGLEAALEESVSSGHPRLVLLEHALYPPLTISARWSE